MKQGRILGKFSEEELLDVFCREAEQLAAQLQRQHA